MATISKAVYPKTSSNICQGDVFQDIRYTYIDSEDDDSVDVVAFTFPMAIVISQACDVNSMSEMVAGGSGKATKFMPSILMCPIYGKEEAKSTKHLDAVFRELSIVKQGKDEALFNSKEYAVVENDWHYRYHALTVSNGKSTIMENALIDFKHYFTVPASYLYKNRPNRLFRLESLFSEQVTLKFSTYLSRVAIP